MRKEAIAAVLVIAIIAGAGVGYFVGVNKGVTRTTTVYLRTSTYSSPVSSLGLELQITLNSTAIQYGGALAAKVALLNTLSENLSLAPRYSSVLSSWEANDFLCGNSPDWGDKWAVDGFAVFSGHFTVANLSSAGSQLVLAPPVAIGCISRPNPNTLVMLPKSDVAVALYNLSSLPPEVTRTLINASTLSCAPNGRGATACGDLDGALFGYWDFSSPGMSVQDANTSSPHFHYFSPGQYTLVAEDLWNDTTFAYFDVTNTTSSASSAVTTCSGYPPGGNCPGNYSYTFVVSINYTGPWKAMYWGYHSAGAYFGQSGNYTGGIMTGTGDSSRSITLSGPNTNGLALCAQAQKLDGSNFTLILTITGHNETSLPYGSVSYCGGVVP
jgi:hypothetical protein